MKIEFSYKTRYGTFNDALILPDDHTYTNSELETMKEARRDNWIFFIENPPEEILLEGK